MSWEQIKEIEKEKFAFIGNHSHSHDYLLDLTFENFKKDINKSIEIFEKELSYNPIFFSYPFGEYSLEQINYIKKKFKSKSSGFSKLYFLSFIILICFLNISIFIFVEGYLSSLNL